MVHLNHILLICLGVISCGGPLSFSTFHILHTMPEIVGEFLHVVFVFLLFVVTAPFLQFMFLGLCCSLVFCSGVVYFVTLLEKVDVVKPKVAALAGCR